MIVRRETHQLTVLLLPPHAYHYYCYCCFLSTAAAAAAASTDADFASSVADAVGTVLKLGTKRHHDMLLEGIDRLEDVGCFGLTELGFGTNQSLSHTRTTHALDSLQL